MATYRDFKEIPTAAKPVKQTVGKQGEDIDKYIAENVPRPEIADAAKQTYTQQTVKKKITFS